MTGSAATTKRRKPLSLEHRAAISAALGGREHRTCEAEGCSQVFEVHRSSSKRCCTKSCAASWRWANKRDRIMPALVEANRSRAKYPGEERCCLNCEQPLGYVNGSRIVTGRGRFCTHSCTMQWQWANRPEGLRRPRLGTVVTCACGRSTRYLRPSRAGSRYCRRCRSARPEVRAQLSTFHNMRRAAVDQLRISGDLVLDDVAQRWGKSLWKVRRVVAEGLLAAERRPIMFTRQLVVPEGHFDQFMRYYVHGAPSHRRRWRQRRLAPGKRGRRSQGERDAGWAELYDDAVAEWRESEELGLLEEVEPGVMERMPAAREIHLRIAEDDYETAAGGWSYDPADHPDRAAERVRKGIARHRARRVIASQTP